MPATRSGDVESNVLACQALVELVTDYLELALAETERRRLEAHLRDCPHCEAYLEQVRQTIRLIGSTPRAAAKRDLAAKLLALVDSWFRTAVR